MNPRLLILFPIFFVVLLGASGKDNVRDGNPSGKNFGPDDYYRIAYSEDGAKSEDELTPAELVNPLMGTDSIMAYSHGNTYPAVALPWGMNFWTPQTGVNVYGWIYTYRGPQIRGFRQTHQPSPWIMDYGTFSLMPMTGVPLENNLIRGSTYRHETEISKPYYYKVRLDRYKIDVEITATERAAIMRFTYPKTSNAFIVIDTISPAGKIKVNREERKITGYTTFNLGGTPENFKNWFVIEFDADIVSGNSGFSKGHVRFKTREGQKINAKIASSFISLEYAEAHLKREIGDRSFEEIKEQGKRIWNEELSRIQVSGGTIEQRVTFYSTLYRVLLFPRMFYEPSPDSGEPEYYSPYDGKVHDGYMYTDNGFWDTFRAVYPFFNIMYPEMNARIMQALVSAYKEGGRLPSWSSPGYRPAMIGAHSASLLGEAYVKGVTDFDTETAWEAMVKDAEVPEPRMHALGRHGVEYYNELGYVPNDVGVNENVAKTLEYAYDDFCMAQFARATGRPQADVDKYLERSMNYRNVFDPSTNFMRGKKKNGEWKDDFNPISWGGDFTEGGAWHYTWSVFHDPQGLINLMGGREAFVEKLDSVFTTPPDSEYSYYHYKIHEIDEMEAGGMGQYAHGNQPIQHAIYLYNYALEPWKAQARVREVMDKLYTPYPNGYCGDEDNGQTSAWYVFSALGMYPVCPCAPEYVIGSPTFDKVVVSLPNGKTLTIEAINNSPQNIYIKRASLNGVGFTRGYLTHDEIVSGGTLTFEMDSEPNKKRGITIEDAPYSLSK